MATIILEDTIATLAELIGRLTPGEEVAILHNGKPVATLKAALPSDEVHAVMDALVESDEGRLHELRSILSDMSAAHAEDADVPRLAVEGLNEATRKARQAGEIVVIRSEKLLKISQNGSIEILRDVPGRMKATVKTKRLKR